MPLRALLRRVVALALADAWIWPVVFASFAYAVATLSGVPMLRQDWGTSPFHTGWYNLIDDGFSGWAPAGIGSPQPYLVDYLICLPITVATVCLGGRATLFLLLLAIGGFCAFGARALAKDVGCNGVGSSAAALFAIFNPWAYTELVAGHVYMLLAYAASFWLFREVLLRRPRPIVLTVAALLTLQQLQFFIVSTLLLGVVAVWRRVWQPLAIAAVVWLPSVIGILAERKALDTIPFTLVWERDQSVRPLDALQLNGYFAKYADGFRGFFATPAFATFAVALVSLRERRRVVVAVAVGTLAALLFSMGTFGPGAALFTTAIEHVRIVAVFRELFDVLGYVAIGYVILASIASARWQFLAWFWLATTILLCGGWFLGPPARFWVPAQTLPTTVVATDANTRFALMPAFQPLSFYDQGSGADPDARPWPGNVTPLNQYLSTYPANAAMASFLLRDDIRPLQALSVGVVVERPWLHTNAGAQRMQWALPVRNDVGAPQARRMTLRAAPELALVPMPAVGALDARLGNSGIFFADAAVANGPLVPPAWKGYSPILRVTPPNDEVDARRGWVDARLAFAERPELAQSLGGALTTNQSALLPVNGALEALVLVDGTLRSSASRILTTTTHGYRWISLAPSVRAVTCSGLCVVAAQGSPPAGVPLEPPPHPEYGVAFHALTPWLLTATVSPGALGALRYNTAYDDNWVAFMGGVRLSHVRLDGTVNGWLLPTRSTPQRLVIVETTAAAQFGTEILALILLVAVACLEIVRRRRQSARA